MEADRKKAVEEAERMLKEQSFPADFGTVEVAPADLVEEQVYEILIGNGVTGWKEGLRSGGNWYTREGSFLAYPKSVTSIRVSAASISAEVQAAVKAYSDLVWTEDEQAADEAAKRMIRASSATFVQSPTSRNFHELRKAILGGYQRFKLHVELPEDVARRSAAASGPR